ncbi:hypothetical protein LINGRAHAP2_LOCUS31392 [Linum grandiflorum]
MAIWVSKSATSPTICILTYPNKLPDDHHHHPKDAKIDPKCGVVLEALLVKLFAEVAAIKAAYAELQMAQNPYSTEVIHAADQLVDDELKTLSDLKRSFVKNELDFISPQSVPSKSGALAITKFTSYINMATCDDSNIASTYSPLIVRHVEVGAMPT